MTKKDTRASWQERVRAWKGSGLSAAEYGRTVGLNPRTLYYWRWRLEAESKADAASSAEKGLVERGLDASCFVEVSRTDVGAAESSFDLVLRSGHRVRVPMSFDDGALARLVAALEVAR